MKCPKCKEEIDHLVYSASRLIAWGGVVSIVKEDKNVYPHWEQDYDSTESDGEKPDRIEFSCPECEAVLFTNQEKAIKWLKGAIK